MKNENGMEESKQGSQYSAVQFDDSHNNSNTISLNILQIE